MADAPSSKSDAPAGDQVAAGGSRLLVDVGPVAIFMIVYNVARARLPEPDKGDAIFLATGVFVVASLAAAAYSWIKDKRIAPMLMVSTVLVTFFGVLTLLLQDALFIKIKPTIVNGLYAAVIFGSLLVGANIWKTLFSSFFTLPDPAWRTLAIRWGCFFVFAALLNEVIWRNFSEAFWANFKLLGMIPLFFGFAILNVPFIMKHTPEEAKDDGV